MKKYLITGFTALVLVGCGSSGSSESSGEEQEAQQEQQQTNNTDCVVNNDTITLSNGESCTISTTIADTYGLSAGEFSCSNGTANYGGFLSAGSGRITWNDLVMLCES